MLFVGMFDLFLDHGHELGFVLVLVLVRLPVVVMPSINFLAISISRGRAWPFFGKFEFIGVHQFVAEMHDLQNNCVSLGFDSRQMFPGANDNFRDADLARSR